jgi:hypothetical protein
MFFGSAVGRVTGDVQPGACAVLMSKDRFSFSEGASRMAPIVLATWTRMLSYEGDPCDECGNYTLVRNGTCMKCNTCSGTSGCSASDFGLGRTVEPARPSFTLLFSLQRQSVVVPFCG